MSASRTDDIFTDPGAEEFPETTVRNLAPSDLDAVVRIDARLSGRTRREYYARKIAEATRESGLCISLAAETADGFAGFVIGRLYYGEFGMPEPVAIIDSIGVDPAQARRHVGAALLAQLERNLQAIGISAIQTQVEWDQFALLGFFAARGFRPAPVLALQKTIAR